MLFGKHLGALLADQDNVDGTKLIQAWRSGDIDARDSLFDALYVELRKLSASLLRGERDISLTTGDLVNEAMVRVIGSERLSLNDKAHFLALAALTMRRILTDRARRNGAVKRDHFKVTLAPEIVAPEDQVDADALENALRRLAEINQDHASIVEMRYFGGMTVEEIAEATGKSVSTIKRGWRVSRAWLHEALL